MSEVESTSAPALELENLQRRFVQGGTELPILRGVSLRLQPGEIIAQGLDRIEPRGPPCRVECCNKT